MVISNRSWLLLRSVARSHRCFWVWPLPGFLALMTHVMIFWITLIMLILPWIHTTMMLRPSLLIYSLWKHLHCIPDSRKTTLFRKVAIGIRRKTPQIIERGEDLVASFDENLRPGRTYQVPHHTHISTKHGLAYILLGFKGITAFIMMTLPSLQ